MACWAPRASSASSCRSTVGLTGDQFGFIVAREDDVGTLGETPVRTPYGIEIVDEGATVVDVEGHGRARGFRVIDGGVCRCQRSFTEGGGDAGDVQDLRVGDSVGWHIGGGEAVARHPSSVVGDAADAGVRTLFQHQRCRHFGVAGRMHGDALSAQLSDDEVADGVGADAADPGRGPAESLHADRDVAFGAAERQPQTAAQSQPAGLVADEQPEAFAQYHHIVRRPGVHAATASRASDATASEPSPATCTIQLPLTANTDGWARWTARFAGPMPPDGMNVMSRNDGGIGLDERHATEDARGKELDASQPRTCAPPGSRWE